MRNALFYLRKTRILANFVAVTESLQHGNSLTLTDMARGRNKELVEARDMRMFERYYYWVEERRLRFDDAIRKLSQEEFFVSESRVMQVVRRMIQRGATVNGQRIKKPLFTGFKVPVDGGRRPAQSCQARQLSLFPE